MVLSTRTIAMTLAAVYFLIAILEALKCGYLVQKYEVPHSISSLITVLWIIIIIINIAMMVWMNDQKNKPSKQSQQSKLAEESPKVIRN